MYTKSTCTIYTGVYHQNAASTNDCEKGIEITDEEECERAANKLGYRYSFKSGNYTHWPKGCFEYHHTVYLSTADPPREVPDNHFIICKIGIFYE